MNKHLLLAIASVFILAGCTEPEDPNMTIGSAEINVSTGDTGAPQHVVQRELKLDLEKGKTYIQNSTSNTTIHQTLGAQQVSTGVTVISQTSFKVLDIKNDQYIMEVKYGRMIMSMVTPQEIKQFSTENPVATDFISMALQNMKNKPFKIVMNRLGKVVEIKGIAALFEDAGKKFKGDNARRQTIMNQLVQTFGEKSFIGNIERCSAIFPMEPVGIGQRWTLAGSSGMAMASSVTNMFELKDFNDSLYHITGIGKVSTDNKDALIEMNGFMMKYDMAGTVKSDITIDRKSGWIRSAKYTQEITGEASVKANEQVMQDVNVPMYSTGETTITDR